MVRWVRFESEGAEKFGTLADDGSTIAVHQRQHVHRCDADRDQGRAGSRSACSRRCGPGNSLASGTISRSWRPRTATFSRPRRSISSRRRRALNDPEGVIRQPSPELTRIFYEGELGIVIGKTCRNARRGRAPRLRSSAIPASTTSRRREAFGDDPNFSQWARAKSCDTFGPIGPAIATGFDWARRGSRPSSTAASGRTTRSAT